MEVDHLIDKGKEADIKSLLKKIFVWLIVIFLVTSPIFAYLV